MATNAEWRRQADVAEMTRGLGSERLHQQLTKFQMLAAMAAEFSRQQEKIAHMVARNDRLEAEARENRSEQVWIRSFGNYSISLELVGLLKFDRTRGRLARHRQRSSTDWATP